MSLRFSSLLCQHTAASQDASFANSGIFPLESAALGENSLQATIYSVIFNIPFNIIFNIPYSVLFFYPLSF
jgi:hypothetical protein